MFSNPSWCRVCIEITFSFVEISKAWLHLLIALALIAAQAILGILCSLIRRVVLSLVPHCAQQAATGSFNACGDTIVGISLVKTLFGSRWQQYWLRRPTQVYSRYEYRRSGSPLLNLPAELRLQIWQEVLGQNESISIFHRPSQILGCASHSEPPTPTKFTRFAGGNIRSDRPNLAFLRACRQIYTEADYLFYTKKKFCFASSPSLLAFVSGLTIVQRRNIRKVAIYIGNHFFKTRGYTQSSLTMDALEVRFAMEALPSLRWLGLFIINCEAEGDKYLAQGVYHLLRNVEVEHSVMVAIVDSSFVDGGWVRCIWSSNCRKDFVNAVWARVRYPGSQLLKRPETEKRRLKGPGYRVDALVWR